MFEGYDPEEKQPHPRLVRLAREAGVEIPLPPAEKKNGNEPHGPLPLLNALRALLRLRRA